MPVRGRIPDGRIDSVPEAAQLGRDLAKHVGQRLRALGSLESMCVVGGERGHLVRRK